MKCEFDYCIYNKESACILDEIRVNAIGMCEACETVIIPKDDLEKSKQKRIADTKSNLITT